MEDNLEWLHDNMSGMKEKIRFRDRIEYRISGLIDNPFGPAIIYFDEDNKVSSKHYYKKGEMISEKEWKMSKRKIKIEKLLKRKHEN